MSLLPTLSGFAALDGLFLHRGRHISGSMWTASHDTPSDHMIHEAGAIWPETLCDTLSHIPNSNIDSSLQKFCQNSIGPKEATQPGDTQMKHPMTQQWTSWTRYWLSMTMIVTILATCRRFTFQLPRQALPIHHF